MSLLKEFEDFLSGLNLQEYREKYTKYKTVELNLAKEILPLRHIYKEYWHKHSNWKDYEQFYSSYYAGLRQKIEDFRDKHFFSEETFKMGFKARIYRTWVSLLTQIQGAYVCASFCGLKNGRRFVGYEINKSYVKIANKRILSLQPSLFQNSNEKSPGLKEKQGCLTRKNFNL